MAYYNLKWTDDDYDNTCEHLQLDDESGEMYCEKYNKSLGYINDKNTGMKISMFCLYYDENYNCWIDFETEAKEKKKEKALEAHNNIYRKLIEEDSKKIQENPDNDGFYVSRGENYTMLKELDKAIMDYNEAIRINPKNANAYANRGGVYNLIGKYEQGINDLNESLQIDPNCHKAYLFRGCYYSDKKEFDNSIADLEKALQIKPDDKTASTVLINARKLKKNVEEEEIKTEKEKSISKWRKISVILASLATIIIVGLYIYTNDTACIGMGIFYTIPFLVLYFSNSWQEKLRGIFIFVAIIFLLYIFTIAFSMIIFLPVAIMYLVSYIITIIYPND